MIIKLMSSYYDKYVRENIKTAVSFMKNLTAQEIPLNSVKNYADTFETMYKVKL